MISNKTTINRSRLYYRLSNTNFDRRLLNASVVQCEQSVRKWWYNAYACVSHGCSHVHVEIVWVCTNVEIGDAVLCGDTGDPHDELPRAAGQRMRPAGAPVRDHISIIHFIHYFFMLRSTYLFWMHCFTKILSGGYRANNIKLLLYYLYLKKNSSYFRTWQTKKYNLSATNYYISSVNSIKIIRKL